MSKDNEVPITMRKSQAEKIDALFSKKKGIFKAYYKTIDFKEPVLFLLRQTNDIDFYENATSGKFEFIHTDGTDRDLILTRAKIFKFSFLDKEVRGYICHEDFPFPLPEDPLISAELHQIAVDKTLHDVKKWKAEEYEARGSMFWKIGGAIAIIILAMAIAYTLGFDLSSFFGKGAEEVAKETAKQGAEAVKETIIRNVTNGAVMP